MQIRFSQNNQSGMHNFFKVMLITAAIFCLAASGLAADRFVDNGNATITDKKTSLMWAKAAAPLKNDLSRAWDYANNSNLGGHTDWRLPTKAELEGLGKPFPFSVFDLKKGEYLTLDKPDQQSGTVHVAKIDPIKKELSFVEGPDRFRYYFLLVRDL